MTELTENYSFETIFMDMPFWSEVCYCPSCKKRYFEATGDELPKIIDWSDPKCIEWQAMREEWMAEFTQFSTDCVKSISPQVTIEHNMSVASVPWQFATTDLVADACDYVGGDLYGGFLEQTFICKYYRNLSKVLPFVYITSRCDPSLSYHITTKTEKELLLHAITALVHNGAFSICDGVNPDGTLCEDVYKGVIKSVFDCSRHYEKYVSGDMLTTVAIWFPHRAKYDWKDNGKGVGDVIPFHDSASNDFIKNLLSLSQIMRVENIPFDIVPSKTIKGLKDDVLAICDVVNIRDDEMCEIEKYVINGGNLYLSGHIGNTRLLELLEAKHIGMTEHNVTYMNPTESGKRFFVDFNQKKPMAVQRQQEVMEFSSDYELLATLTLPYTMTGKREFSAMHSNPPGIDKSIPSAILKNVGKGKILWVAAPIEDSKPYMSRKVVGRIIKELMGVAKFTSTAPAFVEILGWIKDDKKYFAAINQQEVSPIAKMFNIKIELPYKIKGAHLVKTKIPLDIDICDDKTIITLPELDVFHILEIEE